MSPKLRATIEILHAVGAASVLQATYDHPQTLAICAFADSVIAGERPYGEWYLESVAAYGVLSEPLLHIVRAGNAFLRRHYQDAGDNAQVANELLTHLAYPRVRITV